MMPVEQNVTFVYRKMAKPDKRRRDQSTVSDFLSLYAFLHRPINLVSKDFPPVFVSL